MILHCDMDAFYASVEERDRPELVGHPVIVGGSPEKRGVVAAANYMARRYGVHSAMPAVTARRLCPAGIFLPPRISHYAEVSSQIQEIFGRFTSLVEPLSLDEAFLDVTGSEQLFGPAVQIGRRIKQAVREETQLVVSVGVAPNKFLAKIASDLQKPDGFVVVEPDQIQAFLDPLPVERLWGVGRQGSKVFQRLGIRTVGQLRQWPMETLTSHFGSQGEHLWQLAHGIDDRTVVPEREAKSISHETTFEQDIDDAGGAAGLAAGLDRAGGLAAPAARTARPSGPPQGAFRRLLHRSPARRLCRNPPTSPTNCGRLLMKCSVSDFRLNIFPCDCWEWASAVSTHPACRQGLLFDQDERQRQADLDTATDQIRERFGSSALRRATSLPHQRKSSPDAGANPK